MSADQTIAVYGVIAPCLIVIAIWAFADMARLIQAARRGEI